ncbi:MAG: PfkB family carbohydrate kinase [Planctomycetota bacterium]|nr:PfkB family carbohydrate kinase [Planctomycetota bacterium]
MAPSDLTSLRNLRRDHPHERIAFVSGKFNVIHPGHIRLLKFSRSVADILVVALHPDASGSYVPEEFRLAAMRSINVVDFAFVAHNDIEGYIRRLRPDLVVKGAEHEFRSNPEAEWLREWDGKLLFSTDDPRFSHEEMIQGLLKTRPRLPAAAIPREYLDRHDIRPDWAAETLAAMAGVRVCVLGDLILDEYVTCDPLGMSREDPTLVVRPVDETRFIGGAGVVAGHSAGLGGKTSLITLAGDDKAAAYAEDNLAKYGVSASIIRDPDRPTTVKRRYRAQNKTLLRVNRLAQQHLSRDRQDKALELLAAALPETDVLIFSDFSYGMLPPPLVEQAIALCRGHDVPFAADSQTSSQIGDLAKFKGAMLVTPTEVEARNAVANYSLGLVALTEDLIAKTGARNVVITMGENGCLVYGDRKEHAIFTDNLPALNTQAVDVAGAGDSFLAAAAIAMASGADIWRGALLGSIAAAVQVSRIGNHPLGRDDINEWLTGAPSSARGDMVREQPGCAFAPARHGG